MVSKSAYLLLTGENDLKKKINIALNTYFSSITVWKQSFFCKNKIVNAIFKKELCQNGQFWVPSYLKHLQAFSSLTKVHDCNYMYVITLLAAMYITGTVVINMYCT